MKRSRSAKIGLVAFGCVVVGDLAYLLIVAFGVDPQEPTLVNTVFRVVTIWTPVLACWVAAIVATSHRVSVVLAALAVTSWASGAVIYSVLTEIYGSVPSPAVSDIGYLAFYGFLVAAFATLGASQSRRALVPLALEAVIAILGTVSVLLVLVQPVLDAAANELRPDVGPLTLAYPLLDVALVAITAGYASNPALAATRRAWWFIGGIAIFVTTDLLYALLTVAGDYQAGALVDAGWPIGLALVAWWALGFTRPLSTRVALRSAPALRLIAPLIAVVAAIGVLIYASQTWVNLAAVILAAVTLALTAIPILTRQSMLSKLVAGQARVLTELRELDIAKSEMMATLNHEMRTPLTSVLGYLEVVRDGGGGDIPSAADDMLGSAEHSAKRLNAIVDEMLILTRLDAHGLDVDMIELDVSTVASRVVEQLRPIADGRQVTLLLSVAPTPNVLADDSRLGHALTTVTENAIKFTPSGGTVTVSVGFRKQVTISVADTGMGIAPEDLPHLFERFFRGSNALRSAVGGSGLGLAIARGIVELHGGRITAESALGVGTTMTITLPGAN